MFLTFPFLLVGCAYQPVTSPVDAPGFFSGLLHGAIGLVTLIGSIFMEVRIYSFPNSGVGYDFGFVVGLFAVQSFLFLFLLYFVPKATEIIGGFLRVIIILALGSVLVLFVVGSVSSAGITPIKFIGFIVFFLFLLFVFGMIFKFLFGRRDRKREREEYNEGIKQGRQLVRGMKLKSEVEDALKELPYPIQKELLDEWLRGEGGDGWS